MTIALMVHPGSSSKRSHTTRPDLSRCEATDVAAVAFISASGKGVQFDRAEQTAARRCQGESSSISSDDTCHISPLLIKYLDGGSHVGQAMFEHLDSKSLGQAF
jgi:hypothetical protein